MLKLEKHIDKYLVLKIVEEEQDKKRGVLVNYLTSLKKITKNPIVRQLGKIAIKELPGVYSKLSGKVKNKKLKTILQSDFANSIVDIGAAYRYDKLS